MAPSGDPISLPWAESITQTISLAHFVPLCLALRTATMNTKTTFTVDITTLHSMPQNVKAVKPLF